MLGSGSRHLYIFRPRVFLALSAASHEGNPPVHDGASVVTAGLRDTCLGVKSREIWQVTAGALSAQPGPRKTMQNPHFSFLAPPSHARTTLASRFPRSCSDGHYYACMDHYFACVDIAYEYRFDAVSYTHLTLPTIYSV